MCHPSLSISRVSLLYSDIRASKPLDTFDPISLNSADIPFPMPAEVLAIIMRSFSLKDLAYFGAVCKWSRHMISHMSYDNLILGNLDDWRTYDPSRPFGLISRIAAETKAHLHGSFLSWEKRKFAPSSAKHETTLVKFRSHHASKNEDAHVVSMLVHSVNMHDSPTYDAYPFSDADYFPSTIPDFARLKILALYRRRLSKQVFYSIQTRELESLYLEQCSIDGDVMKSKEQDGGEASTSIIAFFFLKRLYLHPVLSTEKTTVLLHSGLVELQVQVPAASASHSIEIYAVRCKSLAKM
jgi:hypothetical protein